MIIADENIYKDLITALRNEGFDVFSIKESLRGASDFDIASLSINPPRIIITGDKDFGELVFSGKKDVVGVIFLRFDEGEKQELTAHVISFLKNETLQTLTGMFVTITTRKIRQTKIITDDVFAFFAGCFSLEPIAATAILY